MAGRLMWIVQDTAGNGQAGLDVDLFRKSDDIKIADFTDAGNGVYYVDHTISERVYIKIAGAAVTATDGMVFPADDVAKSGDLASTASGKGAALIGIEDAGARYAGVNVETVLQEVPTLTQLAGFSNNEGAAIVAVRDTGGYYAGLDVEAVLAEIGAIFSALSGLTASAAELNKLDGADATVTAANLNLLCGTAAISSLHKHNMHELAGNVLLGAAQTDMDVWVRSQQTAQYGKGAVILDVFYADGGGKAYVKKNDENDQAVLAEIMTAFEIGTLNFSGDPVLGQVSYPGKVTQALQLLANRSYSAAQVAGFNKLILIRGGQTAGSASGNAAGDPASTVRWTDSTDANVIKEQRTFIQTPDLTTLWVELEAKLASAGSGTIKIEVGTESGTITVAATSYTLYKASINLRNIAVTTPTWRTLTITVKSVGGIALSVNERVNAWIEK